MLAKRLVSKIFERGFLLFVAAFVVTAGVLLAFSKQVGIFVIRRVPVVIEAARESSKESTKDVSKSSSKVVDDAPTSMTVFAGSGLKERLEAKVRPLAGKKIWDVDMKQLRAAIVEDAWVKDVLISRTFPSALNIRVTQKNPILIMVGSNGEFFPITDEGEVLGSLPAGALPDVPLLRSEGMGNDPREIAKHREQIVNFVMALPEKGLLIGRNISEISWNSEDGITLTVVNPRVEIKLGDDHPEMKITRVTQVLNYLAAHQLKERVIDASFSKKVLVRLRKGP